MMNKGSQARHNLSAFVQLDIFNFVEEQKKEAVINAIKVNPTQLVVGDRVEFISYGGKLLKGIFITKGFWDGRDQENPQYYYFDVDGLYYEINPSCCAWNLIDHDDEYIKPNKYDITEILINHLKNIPFPKRLETYRSFQNQYPYLSYEYHPYVSLAWDEAIIEVTTIEEVTENLKHWTIKEKFTQEVKQFLTEKILPLDGEERLQEMFNFEWKAVAWHEGKKKIFRTRCFSQKNYSVYKSLFQTLIRNADNAKDLINIASIWGVDSRPDVINKVI